MKPIRIKLDFDGTVVEHAYPKIGRCNFGCFEIIKKLQDAGHIIILNTYRSDESNGTLEKALNFINEDYWMCLKDRKNYEDFELQPITEFTKYKEHPHPWNWEDIKESGEMYIDDIATNIPLKPAVMERGEMVDWDELDRQFIEQGIYEKDTSK
jgi:hypothetical protein